MSSVSGATASGGVVGAGYVGLGGAPAGFSPEALLDYCSEQLNGIDGQINTLMQQQYAQLNQEQAVENVDTTLEGFGTTGPTNPTDYQTCINAFNTAIADLPPGDPVAAQLQQQLSTMEGKYGTTGTLTAAQQSQLSQDQATLNAAGPLGITMAGAPFVSGDTEVGGGITAGQVKAAQSDIANLTSIQTGSFKAPQNNDWQGTTDTLKNLASNIQGNAQIQMLSLNSLVSQNQAAIEQATQMMTSEDNTLLDEAKGIGA
jgi:hypothetical protein